MSEVQKDIWIGNLNLGVDRFGSYKTTQDHQG